MQQLDNLRSTEANAPLRGVSMADIVDLVSRYYGLKPLAIYGRDRKGPVTLARHVAFFLCRQTGASFPKIGREFDGRDHATVLYGVRRINDLIERGGVMQEHIFEIKQSCLPVFRSHRNDPAVFRSRRGKAHG